jgi:hypothetical protein
MRLRERVMSEERMWQRGRRNRLLVAYRPAMVSVGGGGRRRRPSRFGRSIHLQRARQRNELHWLELVGVAHHRSSWWRRDEPPAVEYGYGSAKTLEEKAKVEELAN